MANRVINRMVTKDLGPVTAYGVAVANGFTGTEEEWEAILVNATQGGVQAEGYATGTQNGTDVPSDSPFHENNAKYFSELAQAAAGHYPTIIDGHWYIWDVSTQQYVDTGNESQGVSGVSIHILGTGEYDASTRRPTIQDPVSDAFYLIPAEDGESPDMFVEWVYTNNAWEIFGSTRIDLSDYALASDVHAVNQAIDAAVLTTEGYATGKQNGIDVSSDSEYYQNSAKYYAEKAEYSANVAGYMNLEIDSNGHLIYEHTKNLDNIDFELEDGRLIALWP